VFVEVLLSSSSSSEDVEVSLSELEICMFVTESSSSWSPPGISSSRLPPCPSSSDVE
jgi:hypothetical protein